MSFFVVQHDAGEVRSVGIPYESLRETVRLEATEGWNVAALPDAELDEIAPELRQGASGAPPPRHDEAARSLRGPQPGSQGPRAVPGTPAERALP